MDDRRQRAHKTLIDIASASKRLQTLFSRENANLQHQVSARTRLDKIVVASQSILAQSLGNASDTSRSLDARLEDWLRSKEPDMCLHILEDMENLIAVDFGRKTLWAKVCNAFHSMYTEGRIDEAIKLFNKRQGFFHFLLTPEVWNYEMKIQQQPATVTDSAPRGTSKNSSLKGSVQKVDPKKLSAVLQWLDEFSCNEKHEYLVSLRQPDTCEWLPQTAHYKAWHDSDDSFLWLHGKAGAGKTVLVASVIERIRKTPRHGESVVFFYCDFKDERSTSAATVIRSILSQLLRKLRNSTGQNLIQLVDDLVNGIADVTLDLKQARSVVPFVSRAARALERQPFVIVDALDECQDCEYLLHALCELKSGGMRLLVTSRSLPKIKDRFYNLPCIDMGQMAKEARTDIRLHVIRSIDGDLRLRNLKRELKEEIRLAMFAKADGMFRWVQCQIDTLKKCSTARDIRLALQSLPSDLEETYERMLRAIDQHSSDGKVAQRALIWLVAALRPLLLAEILEALSVDLQERKLDRDIAPTHKYTLLDVLGSLVVYNEHNDVVNFSHFCVKEYLVGKPSLTNLPMHHINVQMAHAQVARLCMCYVAAIIKQTTIQPETFLDQQTSIVPDILDSYPLLRYARDDGFRHIQFLVSDNHPVIDSMIALRFDIEKYPVDWQLICKGVPWYLPYLPGLPLVAQHDLIICVLMTLPESFLRAFLRRARFKPYDGTSPLVYATYWNKIEHARMLLSLDAGLVNSPGLDVESPYQVFPLEVAFRHRYHSLFDLLLVDWEAIVPARIFSSLFYGKYLHHNPQCSLKLLRCHEFTEWVADAVHPKQTFLLESDECLFPFVEFLSEKEVSNLLRRLAQLGSDFSRPPWLEFGLEITLRAVLRRSLPMLMDLCCLDMPIPSRILLLWRGKLVEELIHRGLDINNIVAHGDNVLYQVSGACKHGPSCWAYDCNLCSRFLHAIAHTDPDTSPSYPRIADVLFVGPKGAGKSLMTSMILRVPEGFPFTSQGPNRNSSRATSYATVLGELPVQVWDTPGLDASHDVRDKINDWLTQVLSSHASETIPFISRVAQVVWCMRAEEIGDPIAWEQYRVVHSECQRQWSIIPQILINHVPADLRKQNVRMECNHHTEKLGLGPAQFLMGVRSHQGMSSPEYTIDSMILSHLLCIQGTLAMYGARASSMPFHPKIRRRLSFQLHHYPGKSEFHRCGWVIHHPQTGSNVCGRIFCRSDLAQHLAQCHGIEPQKSLPTACQWRNCGYGVVNDIRDNRDGQTYRTSRDITIIEHIAWEHLQEK